MSGEARAVTFVDRLEFEYIGNLFKNAICLGDVDNDKGNELCLGNANGDCYVYKGGQSKPWKQANELGMITTVCIGDVLNENKNFLITISGEGWINIFDIHNDNKNDFTQMDDLATDKTTRDDKRKIYPCFTQRIMANTKSAFVADIDGDGHNQLVIGLTDRVVRSYTWTVNKALSGTEQSRQPGHFVAQNKWEFASQVGTVSRGISHSSGNCCVLVAQPGGTFVELECYSQTPCDFSTKSEVNSSELPTDKSGLRQYPDRAGAESRSTNVNTEVIGCVRKSSDDESSSLNAIATLDGILMLVNGDDILWSFHTDRQLFSLGKLDVTDNGADEIIACAWDGYTYIIDHKGRTVEFNFDETISAFVAGQYCVGKGNTNCLVYVVCNKIYLYYDIRLGRLSHTDLFEVASESDEFRKFTNKLGGVELKKMITNCLYHPAQSSRCQLTE